MQERQILFFKHYFLDFYEAVPKVVQLKIEWTLQLISELDRIPKQYFKHVEIFTGFSAFLMQEVSSSLEMPIKKRTTN